ncbi:hypothetical protein STAS_09557 [Striga asiatica]|uniref:Uncharacterized protein n=1 Tax=Striga asiatica TaxID=4170 RepID=A0A5A7PKY9_STRAF|nr:hypothetical protein STAS_09557 [Striga asiatica]
MTATPKARPHILGPKPPPAPSGPPPPSRPSSPTPTPPNSHREITPHQKQHRHPHRQRDPPPDPLRDRVPQEVDRHRQREEPETHIQAVVGQRREPLGPEGRHAPVRGRVWGLVGPVGIPDLEGKRRAVPRRSQLQSPRPGPRGGEGEVGRLEVLDEVGRGEGDGLDEAATDEACEGGENEEGHLAVVVCHVHVGEARGVGVAEGEGRGQGVGREDVGPTELGEHGGDHEGGDGREEGVAGQGCPGGCRPGGRPRSTGIDLKKNLTLEPLKLFMLLSLISCGNQTPFFSLINGHIMPYERTAPRSRDKFTMWEQIMPAPT